MLGDDRTAGGGPGDAAPGAPAAVAGRCGWHARGEEHLPGHDAWLAGAEREHVARLRFTKRRNDFLVSRWTAKQAVAAALGLPPDDLQRVMVGHRPTGAPLPLVDGVPAAAAMSSTDRAGWAVCLVASPGPAGLPALGCDLELVEPRSDAFVSDWLTPAEQALVRSGDPDVLANLVWSAKESALKVLQTGLRRATRSVEVGLEPDGGTDGGWRPLTVTTAEGARLPGWWLRQGAFVLTTVADADLPPPRPLLLPHPLAGAEPSHTWLADPTT